jgi:hypothetical protein
MKNKIVYTDDDHSYTSNGKKYISVTQLISKFKYPTDWNAVAEAYAKKNGNTAEHWKSVWGAEGAKACDIGSRLHKKKEIARLGYIPEESNIKTPTTLDYSELEDGYYPELLLWNDSYEIAGQADEPFIESKGLKRYIDILDFKSNKKIDLNSYKHFKTGHQMMQGPLKHLQCCSFNHYNLQLSLYAWMMEQHGFIPRNLIVEHYPLRTEDGEVDYNQTPVIYKMSYLKKEITDMLKTYKASKK